MYSTLFSILPVHFPSISFLYKKDVKYIPFKKYTTISISRNPFRRTVSTYYDKCLKSSRNQLQKEASQLQYCQHQLLDALTRIRGNKFEISEPAKEFTYSMHKNERALLDDNFNLLMTVDFEEYVKCLELILATDKADGHFEQQWKAFDIPNQNSFFFPNKLFNNTQCFKLENINEKWDNICSLLDKPITLKRLNQTKQERKDYTSFYSEKTRFSIEKLYKKDFSKFKYSTLLGA